MSKQNRVSVHGKRAFLTGDDELVGIGGLGAGGIDTPFIRYPSPNFTAIFEDFFDTGSAPINFSDTGSAAHAQIAATNGVHRITPTLSQPGDPSVVVGRQLAWKVNQGEGPYAGSLRFIARVKKSSYTTGEHGIFAGFTDVVGAEMPFRDTGGTVDKATATNGFGIMWNLGGDTGWVGVSVDGDSYQETVLGTATPTANEWVVLEVEAHRGQGDTGGEATFYVDGKPLGSIDNPCNISTALTPIVAIYDTGGAATADIDYIAVSAPRDTGT